MKDNNILKKELVIYKQSLDKYSVSLGIQPQTSIKQGKTEIDVPLPPKGRMKRFFSRKNLLKIFLAMILIFFIGYFIYDKFLSGAKLG